MIGKKSFKKKKIYVSLKKLLIAKKWSRIKHQWWQGRSEGTSNVAFEGLVIKSEIDFINLYIFNCLTSNINLFNFNCSTSTFFFPKNSFRKQKRTDVYWRASLVSGFQLNRENDNLLCSRHK